MGMWDPKEHYWGEEDEPIEDVGQADHRSWTSPDVRDGAGVARSKILTILLMIPSLGSNDLKDAGERAEADKILMDLCQADLRCLDAHSHLGNLVFDHRPQDAIRHYEVGLRIGELSLEDDFTGVLRGAISTTARFCAACMAMAYVSGVLGALTRRSTSLIGCSG